MKTLEWDKKFETGNRLMDSQHESLIQEIDACIEASRSGHPKDELIALLECVLRTLEQHFHDEEMIFPEHGEHTKTHLNQHAYAMTNLRGQIEMLKRGDCKNLSAQGVAFPLYEWYVTHLVNEDFPLLAGKKAFYLDNVTSENK